MTPFAERLSNAASWVAIRDRDLLYLPTGGADVLVISCDSDGGIGPKPNDCVSVSGYELGRTATRVPLIELMAVGAVPMIVTDTLSVEMDPTGQTIIKGVLDELAEVGLDASCLTGSTEDNVPTTATGIGVTVIGRGRPDQLRVGRSQAGDHLALVGRPKSAPAHRFSHDDAEIITPAVVNDVLAISHVIEVLPVGSRGPAAEAADLAAGVGCTPAIGKWPVSPTDSGGPSTAMVVTFRGAFDDIVAATDRPVWILGGLTHKR